MPRRRIAQLLPMTVLIVVDAVERSAEQHAAGAVANHHKYPAQLDAGSVLAVVHGEIAPIEARHAFPGTQPDQPVFALGHRVHQVVRQAVVHVPARDGVVRGVLEHLRGRGPGVEQCATQQQPQPRQPDPPHARAANAAYVRLRTAPSHAPRPLVRARWRYLPVCTGRPTANLSPGFLCCLRWIPDSCRERHDTGNRAGGTVNVAVGRRV